MKHIKISIIGAAGSVGSTTAYALMMKNLAGEIILIDVNEKKLKGELMDLSDSLPFCETSNIRSGSLEDAKNSDIVIITAGIAQKPGETRIDIFKKNKKLMLGIIDSLKGINNDAIILVVSNPVDILTHLVQQTGILPKNQILGSGTILDSQRLRGYLSEKLNVGEASIEAYVIGEHGDSEFVAWSHANIANKPIREFQEIEDLDLISMEEKTKNEAYEIIDAKGFTAFGIAACVADICESIVYNQKRAMPVSCFVESMNSVCAMPAIIGDKGVEKVLILDLNKEEQEKLRFSVDKILNIVNEK